MRGLVVVLVLAEPHGEALVIEVLPEPGDGDGDLLVGVDALPLVKDKVGGGKEVERVLGLLVLLGLLLFLVVSLLLGLLLLRLLLLGLLLSLLLLDHLGLLGLGAELDLTEDLSDEGLVSDGHEPAVEVLEHLAEAGVEDELVGEEESAVDGDISDGHALTDEEGAGEEVVIDNLHELAEVTLGLLDGSGAGGGVHGDGEHPGLEGGHDAVDELHPLVDEGSAELAAAAEGLAALGDVADDGVGTAELAVLGLEAGAAAAVAGLGGLKLDLDTGHLGGDEDGLGAEALLISNKLHC